MELDVVLQVSLAMLMRARCRRRIQLILEDHLRGSSIQQVRKWSNRMQAAEEQLLVG